MRDILHSGAPADPAKLAVAVRERLKGLRDAEAARVAAEAERRQAEVDGFRDANARKLLGKLWTWADAVACVRKFEKSEVGRLPGDAVSAAMAIYSADAQRRSEGYLTPGPDAEGAKVAAQQLLGRVHQVLVGTGAASSTTAAGERWARFAGLPAGCFTGTKAVAA